MYNTIPIHAEFARVIACARCSTSTDRRLLRDSGENVPQPGYLGADYERSKVLLVGQNPGSSNVLEAEDRPYTAALRSLRDRPTSEEYTKLAKVLDAFIPQWPVHRNYFPLTECVLRLDEIAYFNLVRCRTSRNCSPGALVVSNCVSEHFSRWLSLLSPRVVVFIGKWASDRGAKIVAALGIPHIFMNRQRSLSAAERAENRAAVVAFVNAHRG